MDPNSVATAIRESSLAAALPEEMRAGFVDAVLEVAQAGEAVSGEVLFRLGEKNTSMG